MRNSTEPLIQARGLTKKFGKFTAVDGIDFDVYGGEAFGFLGPNGAGKTSTMKMIGCASPVSGGELTVAGLSPKTHAPQIKARIGVVPQLDNLDAELTVRQNLEIYARFFDISKAEARKRTDELLDFVQLSDKSESEVESLSGGMRRRLTIARALINEPDLILLDEPTTGLDPQARHLLWERLYRLKQKGVTLVITTHYMDEAEQLCDRLVVMDKAKIVTQGTPRELIDNSISKEVLELRISDEQEARLNGLLEEASERIERLPDRFLLYTDDGERSLAFLHSKGVETVSALVRRSTLEDVFLQVTGRTLVE